MVVSTETGTDAAIRAAVVAFEAALRAVAAECRSAAAAVVAPGPVEVPGPADPRERWALVSAVHEACTSGLVRRLFDESGLRMAEHAAASGLVATTLYHYAEGDRVPRPGRAVPLGLYLRGLAQYMDPAVFDGVPDGVIAQLAPQVLAERLPA